MAALFLLVFFLYFCSMKHTSILLAMVLLCGVLSAQPVKISKKHNALVYNVYQYGDTKDTTKVYLYQVGNEKLKMKSIAGEDAYWIESELPQGTLVPGYGSELTFVDFDKDTVVEYLAYADSVYCYGIRQSRNDIEWTTEQLGHNKVRYTCSINSNKLEFVMDETRGRNLSPLAHYDRHRGVLVEFWRNGQLQIELVQSVVDNRKPCVDWTQENIRKVTPREMANIKKQRLVITTKVFDDAQICWGKANDLVKGGLDAVPYDSVMHFAGGTLILKHLKLESLPSHYQTFVELHQRSNGDAYDRTGSVFVIPANAKLTFFEGIAQHPDSLPLLVGRDGQRYQGVRMLPGMRDAQADYLPLVELMRFFTPFGVGHFNDRVKLDGLEWEDEAYFKQEVTDLAQYLSGDVWIGVFIGNYDGGGHKVTLELKSYPGSEVWESDGSSRTYCLPLFNTCNVLEMAGQNYGRLFGTDSLTVEFDIPEGAEQLRLRYIATGHGGWEGGDEFNPKMHTILVDGVPLFRYTPWREDCGCYREKNPVSGNFWNGMSSSDYSRSGWCPGMATQPVYFPLEGLQPGRHTLTVAIPQGETMEGSFSHWNVSGTLLYRKK